MKGRIRIRIQIKSLIRIRNPVDKISAMFGGELELALLHVDTPDVEGFCPPLN
jgi:hypothetical protein